MLCGFRFPAAHGLLFELQFIWLSPSAHDPCAAILLLPEESIMCIVTFSGVTSGGMVTSGIRCWTYREIKGGWIRCGIGWPVAVMITLGMNVSLINEAISVLLPTPSTQCVWVCCTCTRFVYALTITNKKNTDVSSHDVLQCISLVNEENAVFWIEISGAVFNEKQRGWYQDGLSKTLKRRKKRGRKSGIEIGRQKTNI